MLGSKRLAFPFVCELCTGLRAWLLPFSLSSLLPVELVGGALLSLSSEGGFRQE